MTISSSKLHDSTELFAIDSTTMFSVAVLQDLLPDIETALFFGKVYDLNYKQLTSMINKLFNCSVLEALNEGWHSTELQDYLVEVVPPDVMDEATAEFIVNPGPGEFLPELWASLQTDIAKSIKEVAIKLKDTIHLLPGKTGRMTFKHLNQMNKQRPTLGVYGAGVTHTREADNLLVLDVSGSMTETTVSTIIEDVVAMAWAANAHLAIVSYDTFHWEPGTYNVRDVLAKAQFGGTHYETLAPLFNRDWGTVITVADYDSSHAAKLYIAANTTGSIQTVLDISLVDKPTFLSECVGQLADEVRPILIGSSYRVLS